MAQNKVAKIADPEIVAARLRLDSLYADIKVAEEKQATFKGIDEKIKSLEPVKSSTEKEIADLKERAIKAAKELLQVEQKHATFVLSADKQKMASLAVQKDLEAKIKGLNGEKDNLERETRESVRIGNELKAVRKNEITALEKDIDDLKDKKRVVEAEIMGIENNIGTEKGVYQKLLVDVSFSEAKNKELTAQKAGLEVAVFELLEKLAALKKQKEEQDKINEATIKEVEIKKAGVEEAIAKEKEANVEREKQLVAREKFTDRAIVKLQKYKAQMEEKYGEAFPDIDFKLVVK